MGFLQAHNLYDTSFNKFSFDHEFYNHYVSKISPHRRSFYTIVMIVLKYKNPKSWFSLDQYMHALIE